jgi:hypothetical protein
MAAKKGAVATITRVFADDHQGVRNGGVLQGYEKSDRRGGEQAARRGTAPADRQAAPHRLAAVDEEENGHDAHGLEQPAPDHHRPGVDGHQADQQRIGRDDQHPEGRQQQSLAVFGQPFHRIPPYGSARSMARPGPARPARLSPLTFPAGRL